MMLSWLVIALFAFAVAVALAIGPLIVGRLVLGDDGAGPSHRRGFPISLVLISAGMIAFALMATVFWLRIAQSPGSEQAAHIVVTDEAVDPISASERSLFETRMVRTEPGSMQTQSVPVIRPTFLSVLLPLLAVAGVIAFASSRRRENRSPIVPVTMVALLAAVLLLRVWRSQEMLREATLHEVTAVKTVAEATPPMPTARLLEPSRRPVLESVPPTPVSPETEANGSPRLENDVPGSESATTDMDESEATDPATPVTEFAGTELFGVPRETLPEWTTDVDQTTPIQVLQSGKHATVEAAEQELLAQLRKLLQDEFVREHPEAAGWHVSNQVAVDSGSLLRRAIERSEIQIRDFAHPMYQAYWQVNTAVDAPLYQAWRPNVIKTRLGWLGAGVGLLTLLLGSMAAVLRFDEQTGGTRRKMLVTGTVAMWVAIGSVLLTVA